jgi:hypothetical protein
MVAKAAIPGFVSSIGFIFALQLYYAIAPRLRIAAESDGNAQV